MLTQYITWWGLTANLVWGVLVLVDPASMRATPLCTLATFFNHSAGALSFSLVTSSIAAFVAISSDGQSLKKPLFATLVLLVPQQFFMSMAAGGSALAMWQGRYADGVVRPVSFIIVDQIPWVLAAVLYTVSILEHFGRSSRWKVTG